ncbi:hypothetical protein BOV90_10430 [Solemya velum gill symbiont]|uniref:hypothetical protein n=1 Tax=Solemya velum gill symbiont TaxID=2340 RepID=UPI00099659CC|nr:hypothetical protein [Solemya velum gill symbiont]OOY37351.1 hypothetical protein BOV89_08165 [Solemya velum gill symbiont]OOY39241.1 hypothetical protein BOV90_10430 [Solemya velum gill symbiont]OOY44246.1 hypothetical protein BOV92_09150 [Solemya velum gill symbiont]
MNEKVAVNREKHFSLHHSLLGAARVSLEDATNKRDGYYYHQLITITMSALAIEAICNAFGDRYINDWRDFEKSSPIAKLRLICEHFDIEFDRSKEPWSTVVWLMGMRNKIAHAKPKFVSEKHEWSRSEYDRRLSEEPRSKLEKEITLGRAKQAYKCADNIKNLLSEYIPTADRHGLRNEGWTGSAKLIDDH